MYSVFNQKNEGGRLMNTNNENEGNGVNFTLIDEEAKKEQFSPPINEPVVENASEQIFEQTSNNYSFDNSSNYNKNPYSNNSYEYNNNQEPVRANPYAQESTGQNPYNQSAMSGFAPPRPEPIPQPEPVRNSYTSDSEKDTSSGNSGYSNSANTATVMKLSGKSMTTIIIIVIIACVLSAIGGGVIGANISGNNSVNQIVGESQNLTINPTADITTTEAVAKKVLSSVVGITATGTIVSDDYFFGPSESEVSGVGTGMIIDKEGYILTNSHVVMDGEVKEITVLLSNGEEVGGSVIWSDAGLDLAIVKIEAAGLEPVELGNSDEVAIGSYVAAIGNPLGLQFNGSITQGVVSGLERNIVASDGIKTTSMEGLIQVDAAINSGNSGGPLLNSRGQVIGVNTAKASGGEGMGFAIPINNALPIVEKVIESGSFERVYMGISAANVEVIAENYPNVIIEAKEGAVVTEVNDNSPAKEAGIKVKDVIIEIDGKAITGSSALIKTLLNYSSGDVAKVVINRDGEIITVDVKLVYQSEMQLIIPEDENPFYRDR